MNSTKHYKYDWTWIVLLIRTYYTYYTDQLLSSSLRSAAHRYVANLHDVASDELNDWISFRDLFRSVVADNAMLLDVHKLQYLRISCYGKAGELIKNIQVVEGNFNVAWYEHVQRYENERLLISRMIESLVDIPKMSRECIAKHQINRCSCMASQMRQSQHTQHVYTHVSKQLTGPWSSSWSQPKYEWHRSIKLQFRD